MFIQKYEKFSRSLHWNATTSLSCLKGQLKKSLLDFYSNRHKCSRMIELKICVYSEKLPNGERCTHFPFKISVRNLFSACFFFNWKLKMCQDILDMFPFIDCGITLSQQLYFMKGYCKNSTSLTFCNNNHLMYL